MITEVKSVHGVTAVAGYDHAVPVINRFDVCLQSVQGADYIFAII